MPKIDIGLLRRADFVKTWLMNLLQSNINQNTVFVPSANDLNISYTVKNSGTPTASKLYEILDNSGGANFVTCGAANNTVGTQFYANGTAPTWGTGSLAEATFLGNSIKISGNTDIETISYKFFNFGAKVRFIFDEACTIVHDTTQTGDFCGIKLTKGTNLTCDAGAEIELELRSDGYWYQISGTGVFSDSTTTVSRTEKASETITQLTDIAAGDTITIRVDNPVSFLFTAFLLNYPTSIPENVTTSGRDISFVLPFNVKAGEVWSVKYEYSTETNIISPALLVILDNEQATVTQQSVLIEFDLISTNPIDKTINLVVTLDWQVRTLAIPVLAGQTVHYSLTFNSVSVGTHTATITGDITGSIAGIVVSSGVAFYVYTVANLEKISDTSCLCVCDVQNSGYGPGETYIKVRLGLSGNVISLSPKTIAVGSIVRFFYEFTGLPSGSNTVYFFEADDTPITSKSITIDGVLPIYITRGSVNYRDSSGYWVANGAIDIHHALSSLYGRPFTQDLILGFDLSSVNAGYTAVKLIYPNYTNNAGKLQFWAYDNLPNVSNALQFAAQAASPISEITLTENTTNVLRADEVDLGAGGLAYCTGKTSVGLIVRAKYEALLDFHSLIALGQIKLKFEY